MKKKQFKKWLLPLIVIVLVFAISVWVYLENRETVLPDPSPAMPSSSADTTPTLTALLKAALEPVGRCMYVRGGGWQKNGYGAGPETMSYGVSDRWYDFFLQNDIKYDWTDTVGQSGDGLDCSGLIGYAVYQVFGDSYSNNGYVYESALIGRQYRKIFGGIYHYSANVRDYLPCDIMCMDGHVYMVISSCEDGSVLFVHASPPVVSLCGTVTPDGSYESQAISYAENIMKKYYPESYERYHSFSKGIEYLKKFNQMRWDREILKDPDDLDNMTAEQILQVLYPADSSTEDTSNSGVPQTYFEFWGKVLHII